MTDNKSFRIKNSQDNEASVWYISNHMLHVKFDDEEHGRNFSPEQVDSFIRNGLWDKIEESSDGLPRSFKFYYRHDANLIYTYTNYSNDVRGEITWIDKSIGTQQKTNYGVDRVREHIASGDWIVIPSANEKKTTLSISSSIPETFDQQGFENLKWTPVGEVDVLVEIKAFTEQSVNSTVRIVKEGTYELYSNGYRACYANTDEELLELMAAILVVEKAINKKVPKVKLNIEGIV